MFFGEDQIVAGGGGGAGAGPSAAQAGSGGAAGASGSAGGGSGTYPTGGGGGDNEGPGAGGTAGLGSPGTSGDDYKGGAGGSSPTLGTGGGGGGGGGGVYAGGGGGSTTGFGAGGGGGANFATYYPAQITTNETAAVGQQALVKIDYGSCTGTGPAAPGKPVLTTGGERPVFTFTPSSYSGDWDRYEYQLDGGEWQGFNSLANDDATLEGQTYPLDPSVRHTIAVRIVAQDGTAGQASEATVFGPPDPPVITGVSSGIGSLVLAVTPPGAQSPAADYYEARVTGGDWVRVTLGGTAAAPTVTVPNLINFLPYDVVLRAVNAMGAGPESGQDDGVPLPKAQVASATRGDARVTVAVVAAEGQDATGAVRAQTEYRLNPQDAWQPLPADGVIDGLIPGTTYRLALRYTAGDGRIGDAGDVSEFVAGALPLAPTDLLVEEGNTELTLLYNQPSSDYQASVTYKYRLDGAGEWKDLVTVPVEEEPEESEEPEEDGDGDFGLWGSGDSTPMMGRITGLTNEQQYAVQLQAFNDIGASVDFAAGTGTPHSDAPGNPSITKVEPIKNGARVTFTAPESDGGSPIVSYEYQVDGGTWQPLAQAGATTGDVTELTAGLHYLIRIRATNRAELHSSGTDPSWAFTGAEEPGAPVIKRVRSSADGRLTVEFTAPGSSGGSPITSYDLRLDGGDWALGVPVTDGTVEIAEKPNGVPIAVELRAVNAVGAGAASEPVTGTPLAPPTIAGAVRGNRSAEVTVEQPAWLTPAIGTEFSLDDGATWRPSGSGTIEDLVPGQDYRLRARFRTEAEPGPAGPATTFTAGELPVAPQGLTVRSGKSMLALEFLRPTGTRPEITGFEYELDNSGTWSPLGGSASAEVEQPGGPVRYTLTGLTNGQLYEVRVRAVNEIGEGAASGTAAGTPGAAPAEPTAVSVVAGNRKALVTFTPGDAYGSAVTSWELSTDGGSTYASFTPAIAGGVATTTLTGLANGTTYGLRIRATNKVGTGTPSAVVTFIPVAVAPGGPPTNVSATSFGDGTATVSFTAPADDGGSTILRYEYNLDGGAATALPDSRTIGGLTVGQAYQLRVRAVNASGPGPWSEPALIAGSTVPGVPADLTVTGGDTTATLAFTDVTGATGYEYTTDAGTTWTALPADRIVTGLTNGTTYQIAIRARNSVGTGASSAAVAVTPNAFAVGKPSAPTGVRVTAGVASLTVTWTASDDASVTGYTATADPGPATCDTTTVTTCLLGAEAGVDYTVTVVAHSANGDSDPASAEEPATPTAPGTPTEAPADAEPLTTTDGRITTVTPGQSLTVVGDGYAPYSSVVVAVYSDPVTLGEAVTDENGAFELPVELPADLVQGEHTIVALGVDADGTARTTTLPVTVSADDDEDEDGDGGTVVPVDDETSQNGQTGGDGRGGLPRTGGGLLPVGILLILAGALAMRLARRRARAE